jgi:hypothetical protein
MKRLMLAFTLVFAAISPTVAQQEAIPQDTGHPITCYGRLESGPNGGLEIANGTQHYVCAGVQKDKTSNRTGQRCEIGDECQITDVLAVTWHYYEKEGKGQISTCTGHASLMKNPTTNQAVFSLRTPDNQFCYFIHGAISMADDRGQQCRIGINGTNIYWPLCHATGYFTSTVHLLGKGWVAF